MVRFSRLGSFPWGLQNSRRKLRHLLSSWCTSDCLISRRITCSGYRWWIHSWRHFGPTQLCSEWFAATLATLLVTWKLLEIPGSRKWGQKGHMPCFKSLVWNISLVQVMSLPASPEEMGVIRQAWPLPCWPLGLAAPRALLVFFLLQNWGWRQIWSCFPEHGGHYLKTSACGRWALILDALLLLLSFRCSIFLICMCHVLGTCGQSSHSVQGVARFKILQNRKALRQLGVKTAALIHNSRRWCSRRSFFWFWIDGEEGSFYLDSLRNKLAATGYLASR